MLTAPVLVLFCTLGLSPSPPTTELPSSAAEASIRQLETAWNEAHLRGDVDALDRLWATDITVVVPEMPPFAKEDLLRMWRSMKVVFTEYSTSRVTVRVYGATAVVTGQLHRSRDFAGRIATEDWLFTKTYAGVDGQWKVVAYHASVLPAR